MTEKTSLLPLNLSQLERDLDVAIARIEEVQIPVTELWDPWKCPIDALPFLAWALSVDQWRSDWPEKIKRQVVAGSLDVHRTKGTRPAVEKALNDLGVTVDLVEWFEAEPKAAPYTFDLTLWANENLTPGSDSMLSQEFYQLLFDAVVNAKNTRSGFTFKVGAQFTPDGVGAASAITGMAALSKNEAEAIQEPLACDSGLITTLTGVTVGIIHRKMEA